MNLEVRHLKLIESIARHGTMTRASAELNVSQSALSHQLTELERTVGVRLFQRMPRRMELTPPGERLLASAQVVLGELQQAERALATGSRDDSGVLRISTECYTCYHWLPASLLEFEQKYPGVEVQIVVEATRQPVEALLQGRIDIALVTSLPRAPRLQARPLFRDEVVVIMNSQHELAGRSYIRPSDFAGRHLLTYALPEEELSLFTDILNPAGVRPARISRVELTEAIIELVKANRGIAALARWAVSPYLDPASLKAVRLTKPGRFRDWSGVMTASKKRPRYLDAFLDTLAKNGSPDLQIRLLSA